VAGGLASGRRDPPPPPAQLNQRPPRQQRIDRSAASLSAANSLNDDASFRNASPVPKGRAVVAIAAYSAALVRSSSGDRSDSAGRDTSCMRESPLLSGASGEHGMKYWPDQVIPSWYLTTRQVAAAIPLLGRRSIGSTSAVISSIPFSRRPIDKRVAPTTRGTVSWPAQAGHPRLPCCGFKDVDGAPPANSPGQAARTMARGSRCAPQATRSFRLEP
jgi:hypothetical protein